MSPRHRWRTQYDDYFVLFNLGAVAMTQGSMDDAIHYLCQSLARTQPTDSLVPKIHALLTRSHSQAGNAKEALAACRSGRTQFPDDPELLFWEAILRRDQGDLQQAESCLKRILNGTSRGHLTSLDAGLQGFRSRHLLAEIYWAQSRIQEAEQLWHEVVRECPTFPPAWQYLAQFAFRTETLVRTRTCA